MWKFRVNQMEKNDMVFMGEFKVTISYSIAVILLFKLHKDLLSAETIFFLLENETFVELEPLINLIVKN